MNTYLTQSTARLSAVLFALFLTLTSDHANAQPALLSVVPARGATGVSASAPVQFSFDLPMETSATFATFVDITNPFAPLPVTVSWNPQQTIMTCTPSPAFPTGKTIFWALSGEDITGDPLEDEAGSFTTGGGGGSTGSGTNAVTTAALGRFYFYNQNSAGPSILDADAPYGFGASVTLSSNRTATQILLAIPGRPGTNLQQNVFAPEFWGLFASDTNQSQIETTRFPFGTYTFTIQSATSNQNISLSLPSSVSQPNAPHVSNYASSQAVDPAQPFTLTWDPLVNRTANDFIRVQIGDAFESPDLGTPGALAGTAQSIVIPAGRLAPNETYDASIDFFRASQIISNSSLFAVAYRVSTTQFTVRTTGGASTPLVLTNFSRTAGIFSFDVVGTPGRTLMVEGSFTLTPDSWLTVAATNSGTGRVRIADPLSIALPMRFYRARQLP